MTTRPFAPRSLLFLPGTRPDLVPKALASGADAVVVDLEDAVPASGKDDARGALPDALGARPSPGQVVVVRVNTPRSSWFEADLEAVVDVGAPGVVIPKYEDPDDVVRARRLLGRGPVERPLVVVGVESGAGVADARPLLARGVDAAYFGAEDYLADLGGIRSEENVEVLFARSQVVLAAHLGGVAAIDQAVVDLADDDRFRREARQARQLGYRGKICVHPRQVPLAQEAFTATPTEIAHAEAVLAAAARGVGTVDGQLVDQVHVSMAERVLGVERRVASAEEQGP